MKPDSFNQTAYRILSLLLWLSKEPLSFDEINQRFKERNTIGKTVSQDTLWLYLNTLKALGCKVSRPTKRNGFRYQLTYHPFNYFLTSDDLEVMKNTALLTNHHHDHWDLIYFVKWVQRVLASLANENRDTLLQKFFEESRFVQTDGLEESIDRLEHFAKHHQLLTIEYQSAINGIKTFAFLPLKVFFDQGSLYLLGQAEDQGQTSMLRIDRIKNFSPLNNPELQQRLNEQLQERQLFIIRLFNCTAKTYEPLGEGEILYPDPTSPNNIVVRLRSQNDFLLKQRLLSYGTPFQILYPGSFDYEMHQTLRQMRELYTA